MAVTTLDGLTQRVFVARHAQSAQQCNALGSAEVADLVDMQSGGGIVTRTVRARAAGEQHAAGAGLAVERVEQFSNSYVFGQRAPHLRIEEVLKLVEDDQARRLCRSGCVEGVKERVSLGLRGQAGEIGRDRLLYAREDIGGQFEKAGIFVDSEQHRLSFKWFPACFAFLFNVGVDQRGKCGFAYAADAAQRNGGNLRVDKLRVDFFDVLLAPLDMLRPHRQWKC